MSDSTTAPSCNSGGGNSGGDGPSASAGAFECNICLDTAKDAVVSLCGHLFCWPCIYQWMETRPSRPTCPVCKSGIDRDKVIPLYGRDGNQTDPRTKSVPRPPPQRTDYDSNANGGWGNWGTFGGPAGNFQMSFGIGAFPFGAFFSTMFNVNDMAHARMTNEQQQQEAALSRVLFVVGILFLLWITFM